MARLQPAGRGGGRLRRPSAPASAIVLNVCSPPSVVLGPQLRRRRGAGAAPAADAERRARRQHGAHAAARDAGEAPAPPSTVNTSVVLS